MTHKPSQAKTRGTRRLLPGFRGLLSAMMVLLVLLIGGFLALFWQQHQANLDERIAELNTTIATKLQMDLKYQAEGMVKTLLAITSDQRVHHALRDRDADRLLRDWKSLYEQLHAEQITHFSFFDRDRVRLLRVHWPEMSFGINERQTILEAERTGKPAWGLELMLGSMERLTLRVVQPVFVRGDLLGYVELGKEIEDVFREMHERFGIDLAVTIYKQHLNRVDWEDYMHYLGRQGEWDRLTHSVAIYESKDRLLDAVTSAGCHDQALTHDQCISGQDVSHKGMDWRVSAITLRDVAGTDVGRLLIITDVTGAKTEQHRLMIATGAGAAVILSVLLALVFALLRRTDAGIRAQQAELRESEKLWRVTLSNVMDTVILTDEQGRITFACPNVHFIFGYTETEVMNMGHIERLLSELTYDWAELERFGFISNLHCMITDKHGKRRHGLIGVRKVDFQRHKRVFTVHEATEIMEIGRRLHESEEKFRHVTEGINDVVWLCSRDNTVVLYISPSYEKFTGRTCASLHAGPRGFMEVIHPDDRHAVAAAFQDYLSTGFFDMEYRIVRPDGASLWIHARANPIYSVDGEVLHHTGIATDITERKRADAREAYLKQVLLAIRNVNHIISRESDPFRLIERACVNLTETMGYGQARIALTEKIGGRMAMAASKGLDDRVEEFCERLHRGEFPTCMQRALAQGSVLVIEDPSIQCIECLLSDLYDGQSGLIRRMEFKDRIYGVATVSAPGSYAHDAEALHLFDELAGNLAFGLNRIENDAELRQSSEWLSQILATTHEGFFMADLTDATILRANDRFCQMLGYTESEMLQLTAPDIEARESSEEVRRHISLILEQKYDRFESVQRRKDGTVLQ